MTMQMQKLPTWFRILQIVIGGIAIVLSGYVLSHPITTTWFILAFLGASLIVIGISTITNGILIRRLSTSSRVIDVIIGIFAIIGGFVALVQPLAALVTLIWLVTIFVFMYGAGLVASGFSRRVQGKEARVANIIFGAIVLALSGLLLFSPGLTLISMVILLSIALVIKGIDRIVYGAIGYGIVLEQTRPTKDPKTEDGDNN